MKVIKNIKFTNIQKAVIQNTINNINKQNKYKNNYKYQINK